MTADSSGALLKRLLASIDVPEPSEAPLGDAALVPLRARTRVADLAWASVATASAAASHAGDTPVAAVNGERVAVAYSSERHFALDGAAPRAWAPLSGFFPAGGGWVRTHANYPWHADALRRALGLPRAAGKDQLREALAKLSPREAARRVTEADGMCVVVRDEDTATDLRLREQPVVRTAQLGDGTPRRGSERTAALTGVRVLDLTRVIAGPVATRTLALLGADVLRIDPPHRPEARWQHLDTGHGKRSALVHLRSEAGRRRFAELLRDADVVVLGYRPSGLDALGLDPVSLARRSPGVVVARLTAWGSGEGDARRRGFDSLVQAASGIARIEAGDADAPGTLPAQALDHSAGYLLAAGVIRTLQRQRDEGGSWLVETSLRRIAAELLGLGRDDRPAAPTFDPAPHLQRFAVGGSEIVTAAPALASAEPLRYRTPREWGADEARWLARTA